MSTPPPGFPPTAGTPARQDGVSLLHSIFPGLQSSPPVGGNNDTQQQQSKAPQRVVSPPAAGELGDASEPSILQRFFPGLGTPPHQQPSATASPDLAAPAPVQPIAPNENDLTRFFPGLKIASPPLAETAPSTENSNNNSNNASSNASTNGGAPSGGDNDDVNVLRPGNVILDVDQEREENEVRVTPITHLNSSYTYSLGRIIAVNKQFICYVVKGKKSIPLVRVLDSWSGQKDLIRPGFTEAVNDMVLFSHEAQAHNHLAAVGKNGSLIVWRLWRSGPQEDVKINHRVVVHIKRSSVVALDKEPHSFERVVWHPSDPDTLVATGNDNAVYVWNLSTLAGYNVCDTDTAEDDVRREPVVAELDEVRPALKLSVPSVINDVSFAPDGSQLSVSTFGGDVYTFDARSGQEQHRFSPHNGKPVYGVWHPAVGVGSLVVTGGLRNSEIKLWNANTWTCLQTITFSSKEGESHFYNHIALDRDGRFLFVSNVKENVLWVFHLQSVNRAHFDRVTKFKTKYPILNLSLVAKHEVMKAIERESDQGTEDPIGETQVYCVQTKAIQLLTVPLSTCSPKGPPPTEAPINNDLFSSFVAAAISNPGTDDVVAPASPEPLQRSSSLLSPMAFSSSTSSLATADDLDTSYTPPPTIDTNNFGAATAVVVDYDERREATPSPANDSSVSRVTPPPGFGAAIGPRVTPPPPGFADVSRPTEWTLSEQKVVNVAPPAAIPADIPTKAAPPPAAVTPSATTTIVSTELLDRVSQSEERLIARMEAQYERLESRLTQESAERARQQKEFLEILMTEMDKKLGRVSTEIEQKLLPQLSTRVDAVVAKAVTQTLGKPEVVRAIASKLDPHIRTGVSQAVGEKWRSGVAAEVAKAACAPVQEAFRGTFQNQLIPAFEQSCQRMFKQVNSTFQAGLQLHGAQAQGQLKEAFEKAAATSAQNKQEAVAVAAPPSPVGELSRAVDSLVAVSQTLARSVVDTQSKILDNYTATAALTQRSEVAISAAAATPPRAVAVSPVAAPVQARAPAPVAAAAPAPAPVQKPVSPTAAVAPVVPQAGPPSSQLKEPFRSLALSIEQGRYADAVQNALTAASLPNVVFVLQRLPISKIRDGSVLAQHVLLSLVQQLGFDLNTDQVLKLAWLTTSLRLINPADETISAHIGGVVGPLVHSLRELKKAGSYGQVDQTLSAALSLISHCQPR
eukprot:TRINITY_DN5134_c0_g1_i1.p1 TRINITY_DN5134_c0_g1~~TRINITY_DN5134_c0_g1_i1.p1  ORF type:complete len:1225 (-),score=284.03 TRINITY_DN5134_c0_g1_i1:109-3699(-)